MYYKEKNVWYFSIKKMAKTKYSIIKIDVGWFSVHRLFNISLQLCFKPVYIIQICNLILSNEIQNVVKYIFFLLADTADPSFKHQSESEQCVWVTSRGQNKPIRGCPCPGWGAHCSHLLISFYSPKYGLQLHCCNSVWILKGLSAGNPTWVRNLAAKMVSVTRNCVQYSAFKPYFS